MIAHTSAARRWRLSLLTVMCLLPVATGQTPPPPAPLLDTPALIPTGDDLPVTLQPLAADPRGPYNTLAGDVPPPRRFEFFPTSLLWEPKLADKRDPRLSLVFSDTNSFFSNSTADPSIGLTAGVLRFQPARFPNVAFQMDLFAVAHLRFSRLDESIAQDYRAGVPFTFRIGNVVGKVGYEHTSTQLGDELHDAGLRERRTFERDEIVSALGYLWENQLRVYGQTAYAFYRSIPGNPGRWRYDTGFDWYKREATGLRGQPFAAINAAFDPAVNYEVTMNYQVGWMWRMPDRRLSQFRVYAEFFDGHSMFGQLFDQRERYAGFGISLDY